MATRIITGVIGIALAILIIQTGGIVFGAAALVLAVGAWIEYCRAFGKRGFRMSWFIGLIMIVLMWGCAYFGNSSELVGIIMLSVLLVLAMTVLRYKNFEIASASVSIVGMIYLGLAFSHLVLLRFCGEGETIPTMLGDFDSGCAMLWIALIATWSSDTWAYFVGSQLGRNKLCKAISPGKSVEGFIGGIIGTVVDTMLVGWFFHMPLMEMGILGFLICLIATLGDLVESVMKRYTGIKDSSHIIPGHGGIWDRFDSVLYTVPFVYYFVQMAFSVGM